MKRAREVPTDHGTEMILGRRFAWSARHDSTAIYPSDVGFSLVALSDLGMLDTRIGFPLCPGGCYPNASPSYHMAILDAVGGLCDAVWCMEILHVNQRTGNTHESLYHKKPDLSIIYEVVLGLMKCLLKVRERSASEYVTLVIPVRVAQIPKVPGGLESHANMMIARLRFNSPNTATLEYVLYDPWSPVASNKFIEEEAAKRLLDDLAGSIIMTADAWCEIKITKASPEPEDYMPPNAMGVQENERFLVKEEHPTLSHFGVVETKREAFRKAATQIARDMNMKDDGYCASYSMIMLVLSVMYPQIRTSNIDFDLVWAFKSAHIRAPDETAEERFAKMRRDMSYLVPVLRRGLGSLARTFSLTLHRRAEEITGKSVICCIPEGESKY